MTSALSLLQGPPASTQGVNTGNEHKLSPSPGAIRPENPQAAFLPLVWLCAVVGSQHFFLQSIQQLRCSSSVNQPSFILILSHYFLIILPRGSLNKSSLLPVFIPSRYFSLLHPSGIAQGSFSLPSFHCVFSLLL